MSDVLLEIKGLKMHFNASDGIIKAVDDIDLRVVKGKVLGIVGESGCGKSVTALSILRLLPKLNTFIDGKIYYEGVDLLQVSEKDMQGIRGNKIAMIFQEPMTALNPVFTVGRLIGEPLRLHKGLTGGQNRAKCIELIKLVGIPRAQKVFNEYPHQLSGGMRQRVMIAMALSLSPSLIIADEPTTALDVTIQAQILELIKGLKEQLSTAIMLITHDLGVIAEIAEDVVVMYAGKIVEETNAVNLFDNPMHPYTLGLMRSRPKLIKPGEGFSGIRGKVPDPQDISTGCVFSSRCDDCMPLCRSQMPVLKEVNPGHRVRCWLYKDKGVDTLG